MSKQVFFKAIPFDKKLVTLALESGVDGIVVRGGEESQVLALGRIQVLKEEDLLLIPIKSKQDEDEVIKKCSLGKLVVLPEDTEIIPVENILARTQEVGMEVSSLEKAKTALGILEVGVGFLVVTSRGAKDLKEIVKVSKLKQGKVELQPATIKNIKNIGLGHRVCVDTVSLLSTGQGMLVGNSSKFTFLIHAETEANPYVAPRPFRVNAGGVHSYTFLPQDKTCYLEELEPGKEVLIVNNQGETEIAVVGRVKTEIRPLLLLEAEVDGLQGSVIIQNAETIRLVDAKGKPVSVVQLKEGDKVLCHVDEAGRHFGMRIKEEIIEK